MDCQPWLGGRALTSVGASRNAVLWARAEEQEGRDGGCSLVSQNLPSSLLLLPEFTVVCRSSLANNLGLYVFVLDFFEGVQEYWSRFFSSTR